MRRSKVVVFQGAEAAAIRFVIEALTSLGFNIFPVSGKLRNYIATSQKREIDEDQRQPYWLP